MPSWPVELPIYPLVDGYAEHLPKTTIRTEMDQGPAKIRQRTTAGVRRLKLSFLLNKSQTDIFDDFYLDDLSGGAVSFDFTHPRRGEVVTCRFVDVPQYQSSNGQYYRVVADLEVMP